MLLMNIILNVSITISQEMKTRDLNTDNDNDNDTEFDWSDACSTELSEEEGFKGGVKSGWISVGNRMEGFYSRSADQQHL